MQKKGAGEFFEFNGEALPFDITDIQTARRLQLAVENMEQTEYEQGIDAQRYCNIIRSFFDCALGSGAAARLFGMRRSAAECENAFLALVECVNRQLKSTAERRQALYEAVITPEWERQ